MLYSKALRFSTYLSQTGNSQALACFCLNSKILFLGIALIFYYFKRKFFSFAEGSLFFYADLFRQRWGSALGTPANQSSPGGLTSWGVPSPANFFLYVKSFRF